MRKMGFADICLFETRLTCIPIIVVPTDFAGTQPWLGLLPFGCGWKTRPVPIHMLSMGYKHLLYDYPATHNHFRCQTPMFNYQPLFMACVSAKRLLKGLKLLSLLE